MRNLPRLPEGASADEKIRIIYDWLYEWSKTNKGFAEMEMNEENTPLSQAEPASHQQIPEQEFAKPFGEPLKE